MLLLAADENFNQDIVRGVLRRLPQIDFVTVQEAGLAGEDDPKILDWAAEEDRVIEDIILIAECSLPDEWARFSPCRSSDAWTVARLIRRASARPRARA